MCQNQPKTTYLYLVCLEKRYAKAFLECGWIRFAEPKEWADLDDTDGMRGDRFEGVYASMVGDDAEVYRQLKELRPRSHSFQKYDRTYFYSDDMLEMRAYCIYGLNDTIVRMQDKRSPDHKFHQGGTIPASYFNGLFEQWTKEHYKSSDDERKPVVLMIQPKKFKDLLLKRLYEFGIRDSEIMFQPINYLDYKGD